MAAPRTVWSCFVQFGTFIKDRPLFIYTKFHVFHLRNRHQLVKVGLVFTHATFEPYDRFSKMRYCWIPWIKTGSIDPMTSIYGYIDFPPFWILRKHVFSLLLQFLSYLPQICTHHRQNNPHYKCRKDVWFSKPLVRYSQTQSATKQPNRKLGQISANLLDINTKLGVSRGRHYNMFPCAKAISYLQKWLKWRKYNLSLTLK